MEWAWVIAAVLLVAVVLLVILVVRRNLADDRRVPRSDEPTEERRKYPTGWNRSTGESLNPDDEEGPPGQRGGV
ncbi:hypothetical protein [Nocardiopsis lambiniae]|uniref:Secreted protein n=1 Tax=Nocardiopsis lambiniae TaxID=3075539 RepID=A0ABU2MB54_9ACTN|nr:hypothetical protein [Nocardiopsis sp. DSM 44743]MDT0329913.1 hypothetical protein [Nocardiopsis sp. DSM 44743]